MTTKHITFLLIILTAVLTSGCGSIADAIPDSPTNDERAQLMAQGEIIDTYRDVLLASDSSEEEADILYVFWNIANEHEDISLYASAIDETGTNVITHLRDAQGDVNVTIELLSPVWSKTINYTAINVENLFILLDE